MPKRIVVCCDGTWNTADQVCDGSPCSTNVAKLAVALADHSADGTEQQVFYVRGVGTSRWDRIRGGAFGYGLSDNVKEAYRLIAEHFEPGDELYLFGFSRGAYTARSTAGFIRNAGILRRPHLQRLDAAYELYRDRANHPRDVESELFRRSFSHETRIRCIGVWDTVGALGVPLSGIPIADAFNKRWAFHDTELSSIIDNAFQALAIDELRKPFQPTLWQQRPGAGAQRLEQVWFAGVHCDVGGGYPETGLSDIALRWMMDRAQECDLAFQPGQPEVAPDPLGTLHDSRTGAYTLLPPHYRPIGVLHPDSESAASSAVQRTEADDTYRPPNLMAYLRTDPRIAHIDG
jgi:uncharacterized protein (DUF2235 family)